MLVGGGGSAGPPPGNFKKSYHFDISRDLLLGANIFALLEQMFALTCSKPIFEASASKQILNSAERQICSNTIPLDNLGLLECLQ